MRAPEEQAARPYQGCSQGLRPVFPCARRVAAALAQEWGLAEATPLGVQVAPALQ